MFGPHFYFGSTRKVILAFGTLFNDISIVRTRLDSSEYETFKVPIEYADKEKYIRRTKSDPDLQKKVQTILPRLEYEVSNIVYDGSRHLNSLIKNHQSDGPDKKKRQFAPVPYDIEFELKIYTRYQDEGFQILEQILPWFCPHYTLAIKSIPDLDLRDDLPIVLNNVGNEDNVEGQFQDERMQIRALKFTAKAMYYGPVRTDKIIKKTQIDLLIPPSSQPPITDEDVASTPRSVRITAEVDPLSANEEDPHTIVETLTEYDDGKKYNPVTDADEDI